MVTAIDERVPPLGPGDKLTRQEFLRRWEAHPEIKRAELIGGIVYIPSPVRLEHGSIESDMGIWLGTYRMATAGTDCGYNTTTFLLDDTPQPDLHLRILPEYGGNSREEDGYLGGIPELLAEVCLSSAAYDLHIKYDLYETAQVPEYLPRMPMVFGDRASFRGSGSTERHFWRATWQEYSSDCKTESSRRRTMSSWLCWLPTRRG